MLGENRLVTARKIAAHYIGKLYLSPAASRIREWRDAHHIRREIPLRTACVAHVFYPHLLTEVLDCYARMPAGTDLIITIPHDRLDAIKNAIPSNALIFPCENRGRDIGPFIRLLNAGCFDVYDAILKIHTKRSPHLMHGEQQRRLLFTALAGTRKRVNEALSLFTQDDVGIIGWRETWYKQQRFWKMNKEHVSELCVRMKTPLPDHPCFFGGSMFWFRPKSLERLKKLSLTIDDFELEEGQLDGMLHHAIERSFCIAAAAGGYRILDLRGKILF